MKVNSPLWLSCLLILSAGCESQKSLSSIDSSGTKAIIGGTEIPKDDVIAQRTAFLDFGMGRCTSIVLDTNIILTAAHCVKSGGVVMGGSVVFSTTPQADWFKDKNKGTELNIDAVIVHPSYNDGSGIDGDIALIRLEGKIPAAYKMAALNIEHADFLTHAPVAGILAGYGKTKDYYTSDETEVKLRMANVQALPESFASAYIRFQQDKGESACAGDSGGPAFMRFGDELRVVGVASHVEGGPLGTCMGEARYTNISYYKEWLKQSYRKLVNADSNGRKDLL